MAGLEELLKTLQERVNVGNAVNGEVSVGDVVAHWQMIVGDDGEGGLDLECANCDDLMATDEAVICSCGTAVCECCYDEYGHAKHDVNPNNAWLRQAIADAETYLAEV